MGQEGGACIVPSSAVAGGYPDMLTFIMAKKLKEEHNEEMRRVICYSRGGGASAGASGGTLATRAAMSAADENVRKKMADPYSLGGYVPEIDRNGIKEVIIQQGTGKVTPKGRKEDTDAVLSKVSQSVYWRLACPMGLFIFRHTYCPSVQPAHGGFGEQPLWEDIYFPRVHDVATRGTHASSHHQRGGW